MEGGDPRQANAKHPQEEAADERTTELAASTRDAAEAEAEAAGGNHDTDNDIDIDIDIDIGNNIDVADGVSPPEPAPLRPFKVPDAFGVVEPGVYRSATVSVAHFAYLPELNLRSVLLLSPEMPELPLRSFCDVHNVNLFHLGQRSWTVNPGWRPISDELIKEGLEFILDAAHHPLLICCTSGVHETGLLCGCLRRLQKWSFNSTACEYRSFAGPRARYHYEQYIEMFDTDLVCFPPTSVMPEWMLVPGDPRYALVRAEAKAACPVLHSELFDLSANLPTTGVLPQLGNRID